jgi:drug/metabolite transporter (DMT)-like permease
MLSGKRILSIAVVASLCATAALAIAILLFSEFGRTQGRILGTTALLALSGLLALPAGILFDQRRLTWLATAMVVLATVGFMLAVTAIWLNDPPVALGKAVATVVAFTVASTQTAALVARGGDRERPSVRRLFASSLALALVGASMIAAAAWAEIDDNELYYRILGALVVADVLTVVLQPVLARAGRVATVHRLRLLVEPGGERELDVEAPTFAAAVARAVAGAEQNGSRVLRIERRIGTSEAPETRTNATEETTTTPKVE